MTFEKIFEKQIAGRTGDHIRLIFAIKKGIVVEDGEERIDIDAGDISILEKDHFMKKYKAINDEFFPTVELI